MHKLTDKIQAIRYATHGVFLLISLSRPRCAPKQQFVTFYPAEAHASPSRFPDSRTLVGATSSEKTNAPVTYNDRRELAIIRRETTWSPLDFR